MSTPSSRLLLRCGRRHGSHQLAGAATISTPAPPPSTSSTIPTRRPVELLKKRPYTTWLQQDRQMSAAAAVPAFDTNSFDDPDHLFQTISLEEIQRLASCAPTPLRLADLYTYGRGLDPRQRLRNSQFLHRELPIRLAQRAVDLLTLPHGLSAAPPIRQVASMYMDCAVQIQKAPLPQTFEQEEELTDLITSMISDRTSIPTEIARGVQVWQQEEGNNSLLYNSRVEQEMDEVLYRFFTARVGLRLLTEHHVLSSPHNSDRKRALIERTHLFPDDKPDVGCIQSDCHVVYEIERVANLVRAQTQEYLQRKGRPDATCPEIVIVDCNKERFPFTFVPHHLHYMLAELLKNSVRATLRSPSSSSEPIKVVVAKGAEDVTIKIADRARGIPRSRMQTIWKFAHYLHHDEDNDDSDFGVDGVSGAGIRGYGLPLARIYARYFGGELTLKSTEGYGLDAYLYLPRLGDACEHLPLRVRHSPGEQDSMPTMYDERVQQIMKNNGNNNNNNSRRRGGGGEEGGKDGSLLSRSR